MTGFRRIRASSGILEVFGARFIALSSEILGWYDLILPMHGCNIC